MTKKPFPFFIFSISCLNSASFIMMLKHKLNKYTNNKQGKERIMKQPSQQREDKNNNNNNTNMQLVKRGIGILL